MDVLEAIGTRRSVRSYSPRAIPDDVLGRMRQALHFAPSACNFQPWRFIFVTDPTLRRSVAELSNEQLWMADAPVTVVGCGFPEQAFQHMGGYGNSIDVDIAIALDHLSLAAVAEGLGTCWIGAFNEGKIKSLLGIPEKVKVVAMMPMGYPASDDLNAPLDPAQRKPVSEVFRSEKYGKS
ncbi:MAG: nitroreductase family protein [Phycisphaerales bacterium]|nr:MAG: nitroreductase family protein [Phycisphaerales bacterium]